MARNEQDLKWRLSADASKFKQGLNDANKSLSGFQKQNTAMLKSFAGAFAAAFSVTAVIAFTKKAAEAADIQVKAETKLLGALNGRRSVTSDLIRLAGELQTKTLFGDEVTIDAMASLAIFVKEEKQLKALIPVVQDMATVLKMDLSSAANLVGKSIGSSTNALQRYGIKIEGAAGSNERAASAISALTSKFKGQAEMAAKVGLGPFTQLKNAIGDVWEAIGIKLLPAIQSVSKSLTGMASSLAGSTTNLEKEREEINRLVLSITGYIEGSEKRVEAINQLKLLYPSYFGNLDAEKTKNSDLIGVLRQVNDEYAKRAVLEQYADELAGIAKQAQKLEEKRVDKIEFLRDFAEDYNYATTSLDELLKKTKEFINYQESGKSTSKVSGGYLVGLKNAVSFLEEYQGKSDEILNKQSGVQESIKKVNDLLGVVETATTQNTNAIIEDTDAQKTAYETLTAKITELEKKRQDLALANKDVSDITAQINGLKEQKSAVDDLLKSLDPKTAREFREEMQKAFDLSVETRKQMAPTFTDRYERPIIAGESQKEKAKYEPIDTTQLADMTGKIEANLLKVENAERSLQATTIDIGREIEGVFQNMATGIGESLGNMIAGIEGYDNAGNMVIGVLADLAVQVGQIAVGVGVATLGIKEALEDLNPAVAIAAGVALIALGTAAKGALSKAAGGGGGSYNSGVYDTRSISSQKQMAGLQANAMRVEIIGETSIKNKDIYIAYKNAESNRKIKT